MSAKAVLKLPKFNWVILPTHIEAGKSTLKTWLFTDPPRIAVVAG